MRINLNDTISGVPVRQIRKMLRKDHLLSIENIMEELKIDEAHATVLLKELIDRGMLELDTETPRYSNTPYWRTTITGNAFAIAKAGKPITRKSAERILSNFMERVREVCANPYYLYKVKTVVIFGSYLSDSPTMNDIDVAVEIVWKETDLERRGELLEERIELLIRQGKRPKNIVERVTLPETEVRRFLKSHSPALSLHDVSDEIWRSSKHLVVYQD
jgi:predicted nucleotidyltransferase